MKSSKALWTGWFVLSGVVVALAQDPCAQAPLLSARPVSPASLELRWEACTNSAYHLERSGALQAWGFLGSPQAVTSGGGGMTNVVAASEEQQFFRLRQYALTNSSVPTVPGNYYLHLASGGIPRQYRLVIPSGYNAALPAPLAFIFHGSDQTANMFAAQHPALSQYASSNGVVLVLPNATATERGTGWNVIDPTPENPVDNVAFVLHLLEHLDTTLNIDRKRVYAGGFSNGGQMSHWLAARTTNVFAAIAAVGSAIAGERNIPGVLEYVPAPSSPVPALIVNATNDCTRPYHGGTNVNGQIMPAVWESLAHYTNANVCGQPAVLTTNYIVSSNIFRFEACGPKPPPGQPQTNLVIIEHYQNTCVQGTESVLVTLTDGGHIWPDASDNVGFDANRAVLEFFLKHCNCNAVGATNWLTIPTTPGDYNRSFCDQGYWRTFRLMIPASYNGLVQLPLMFTFHGGSETLAEFSAQHPDLFTKCDTEDMFLVLPEATVHPESRDTLWGNKPFDVVVDDRAFVTNLLEQLDATLAINRKKIYASGFSSGGRFTQWMAATWTNVFAGIAAVGAMNGWNDRVTDALVSPPPALEPLPVFLIRGSLDTRQPFFGGTNDTGHLTFSAADDLAYWVSGSVCVGAPTITTVGVVQQWHYGTCAGGYEVQLEGVSGLGHEWPESPAYNASIRIVDFLLPFSRP